MSSSCTSYNWAAEASLQLFDVKAQRWGQEEAKQAEEQETDDWRVRRRHEPETV